MRLQCWETYGKNKEVSFRWDAGSHLKLLLQITHMLWKACSEPGIVPNVLPGVLSPQQTQAGPFFGCISPILQARRWRRHN